MENVTGGRRGIAAAESGIRDRTTVAVSGTSWTHSGVAAGTSYEYRVRATNAIGDGAWSNSTSATAV